MFYQLMARIVEVESWSSPQGDTVDLEINLETADQFFCQSMSSRAIHIKEKAVKNSVFLADAPVDY